MGSCQNGLSRPVYVIYISTISDRQNAELIYPYAFIYLGVCLRKKNKIKHAAELRERERESYWITNELI